MLLQYRSLSVCAYICMQGGLIFAYKGLVRIFAVSYEARITALHQSEINTAERRHPIGTEGKAVGVKKLWRA